MKRIPSPAALALAIAFVVTIGNPVQAYPRPGETARVSVASDGSQGDGGCVPLFPVCLLGSAEPSVSADGRYVAFQSASRGLVPEDTGTLHDIFVHDRATGVTELISANASGLPANERSYQPEISPDGRYVAFHSGATDLVPADANGVVSDVFVHDRLAGTTELVSVATGGAPGNASSQIASMSADARVVVFKSWASTLVPGDTNGVQDIFVRDRDAETTERISVAAGGAEGNGPSEYPWISGDGRYVVFESAASNLVPGDGNGTYDVFLHDREAGRLERLSVDALGIEGDDESRFPSISADGNTISFSTKATNLLAADTNLEWDILVTDRDRSAFERVSISSTGEEANHGSTISVLSADGRYVVFNSSASNLAPGDAPAPVDVFLHDRVTGTTELVSLSPAGFNTGGDSRDASVSADGRIVAFEALDDDLVPGDTNGAVDIFARDRGGSAGVAELSVQAGSGTVTATGWATFSGAEIAAAADLPGDGVDPLGAEIVGASVVVRPEQEDLMLRTRLASLRAPALGALPGVVYRWRFTAAGTAYEVRAQSVGVAAGGAAPSIGLFRCAPGCDQIATLEGGVGTAGDEVRVAVPLAALGAASLTGIEASVTLGDDTTVIPETLDEIALGDASIPVPTLELAIAPAATPEGEVAYAESASLVAGSFSGTLDTSVLPSGVYRVWARGCLAEICGGASAPLDT